MNYLIKSALITKLLVLSFSVFPMSRGDTLNAIQDGDIAGIKQAAENNVDFNISYGKGQSLLTALVQNEQNHSETVLMEMLSLLVDNGLDIRNPLNYSGRALYNAVSEELPIVAIYLIQNGANVNYRGLLSRTILMESARVGLDEVTLFLLDTNQVKNINALDKDGSSVLLYAIPESGSTVFRELINKGADVNLAEPRNNLTPLLKAVWQDTYDIIELLAKSGANPNTFDLQGYTPLTIQLVPWERKTDDETLAITKLLISHGAAATTRATLSDGKILTPLSMATEKGHVKTASFLRSVGARIR